jgi:hypothetical protein
MATSTCREADHKTLFVYIHYYCRIFISFSISKYCWFRTFSNSAFSNMVDTIMTTDYSSSSSSSTSNSSSTSSSSSSHRSHRSPPPISLYGTNESHPFDLKENEETDDDDSHNPFLRTRKRYYAQYFDDRSCGSITGQRLQAIKWCRGVPIQKKVQKKKTLAQYKTNKQCECQWNPPLILRYFGGFEAGYRYDGVFSFLG